ncbi:purine-binding chemotaxis protein CheW [Rhizomicrobium palustre]|uniref:Purine-binding chemotaxis protein CheW n=1 Tax=Rhizomicrobium palustre TaxID=189966 RepID=A0A846N1U9_9PROT|nr:chemotaxis protein CheW [Rhizomicrobium palustre]NIK89090.1 purine-binding chemotaxis protein CheW [Rhizomicrobium palustre]
MQDNSDIAWDNDHVRVLTFDLSGETFALEANLVCEILDLLPETAVPGATPLAASVINFRGSVIPVADLRLAFGLAAKGMSLDSRFIVIELDCEGETVFVGLKADKVFEVTTLTRAAAEGPPRIGTRWRQDFIRCIAKRNGDFIVVPNLHRIFATCGQSTGLAGPQH